jgi:shikimate dehydrogenase
MLETLRKLVSNAIDLKEGAPYAAILGESPSTSARSPKLWNFIFTRLGLPYRMVPLDVSEQNLGLVFAHLCNDPNFIGGAVAVPYKVEIFNLLGDRVTKDCRSIGAINCMFRGGDDDILYGANTDGIAALDVIESRMGPLLGKNAVVIGFGGVGRAISTHISRAVGHHGSLSIVCRTRSPDLNYARTVRVDRTESIENYGFLLKGADVLINCTSVGAGETFDLTPIDEILLSLAPKHCLVFDVVFGSRPNRLERTAKSLGLEYLDGSSMNLEQAVFGFKHVCDGIALDISTRHIRELMYEALIQYYP